MTNTKHFHLKLTPLALGVLTLTMSAPAFAQTELEELRREVAEQKLLIQKILATQEAQKAQDVQTGGPTRGTGLQAGVPTGPAVPALTIYGVADVDASHGGRIKRRSAYKNTALLQKQATTRNEDHEGYGAIRNTNSTLPKIMSIVPGIHSIVELTAMFAKEFKHRRTGRQRSPTVHQEVAAAGDEPTFRATSKAATFAASSGVPTPHGTRAAGSGLVDTRS